MRHRRLAANVPTGSGVSGNLVTDGSGNSTVYLQGATVADTLNAIDLATGVQTATIAGGAATLATATGQIALFGHRQRRAQDQHRHRRPTWRSPARATPCPRWV